MAASPVRPQPTGHLFKNNPTGGGLVGGGNDFAHIPTIAVADLVAGSPGQAAVAPRPARAGTRLHGPNLFPERPEGLRGAVLEYMAALTALGHRLMAGLALSLGLEESYFAEHGTAEPLTLFRIFIYPPPADPTLWGVGEH